MKSLSKNNILSHFCDEITRFYVKRKSKTHLNSSLETVMMKRIKRFFFLRLMITGPRFDIPDEYQSKKIFSFN